MFHKIVAGQLLNKCWQPNLFFKEPMKIFTLIDLHPIFSQYYAKPFFHPDNHCNLREDEASITPSISGSTFRHFWLIFHRHFWCQEIRWYNSSFMTSSHSNSFGIIPSGKRSNRNLIQFNFRPVQTKVVINPMLSEVTNCALIFKMWVAQRSWHGLICPISNPLKTIWTLPVSENFDQVKLFQCFLLYRYAHIPKGDSAVQLQGR